MRTNAKSTWARPHTVDTERQEKMESTTLTSIRRPPSGAWALHPPLCVCSTLQRTYRALTSCTSTHARYWQVTGMDWDFRSISFQAARDMFYNRFYDRYNENQRQNRLFKRDSKGETKHQDRAEAIAAYTLVAGMHGANNQSGRRF